MFNRKIALIINAPDRDRRVNERIKAAILALNAQAEVRIFERQKAELPAQLMNFRPDVVMTCPLTAQTMSRPFYILKAMLGFTLICFRTEGILNLDSEGQIEEMAGLDKYGKDLVDFELFWGELTAKKVGAILLQQGKISSADRIQSIGYPYFEDYLGDGEDLPKLPDSLAERIDKYDRGKVVTFVTGFHLSEYSPEDVRNAGDLIEQNSPTIEEDFQRVLEIVGKIRDLRSMWIRAIGDGARAYPDTLFVVKTHPMENIVYRERGVLPYQGLNLLPNVCLITQNVPLQTILSRTSLLFHYGSTTMLEAYISQVPAIYVNCRRQNLGTNKLYELGDLGIPFTASADIEEIPDILKKHRQAPIPFERLAEVENYLSGTLNIRPGQPYRASADIARFLLSLRPESRQTLSPRDPHLGNAIETDGGSMMDFLVRRMTDELMHQQFERVLEVYLKPILTLLEGSIGPLPRLYYLKAICLLKLDRHREAFEAIKTEIGINPNDEEVTEFFLYLQTMKFEKAEA